MMRTKQTKAQLSAKQQRFLRAIQRKSADCAGDLRGAAEMLKKPVSAAFNDGVAATLGRQAYEIGSRRLAYMYDSIGLSRQANACIGIAARLKSWATATQSGSVNDAGKRAAIAQTLQRYAKALETMSNV